MRGLNTWLLGRLATAGAGGVLAGVEDERSSAKGIDGDQKEYDAFAFIFYISTRALARQQTTPKERPG
jgi:hypothetical protein